MSTLKPIRSALVSVYNKDRIAPIVEKLHSLGVKLLSTGGSRSYIESLGIPCDAVEDLTGYPSILGGRVKTLHPKVFGGILGRRENESDREEMSKYEIPAIDLVIVDLYPFEDTVASGASEQDIIEKIDIGGISLIRAAAKNFADTIIVASVDQFPYLAGILDRNGATARILTRVPAISEISMPFSTNFTERKSATIIFLTSMPPARSSMNSTQRPLLSSSITMHAVWHAAIPYSRHGPMRWPATLFRLSAA